MSYRVHGRRFAGSLAAPTQNDAETQDYDDKATAIYYGEALVKLGYRVWIFERGPSSPMDPPPWSTVAEWLEDGTRLR